MSQNWVPILCFKVGHFQDSLGKKRRSLGLEISHRSWCCPRFSWYGLRPTIIIRADEMMKPCFCVGQATFLDGSTHILVGYTAMFVSLIFSSCLLNALFWLVDPPLLLVQ